MRAALYRFMVAFACCYVGAVVMVKEGREKRSWLGDSLVSRRYRCADISAAHNKRCMSGRKKDISNRQP